MGNDHANTAAKNVVLSKSRQPECVIPESGGSVRCVSPVFGDIGVPVAGRIGRSLNAGDRRHTSTTCSGTTA